MRNVCFITEKETFQYVFDIRKQHFGNQTRPHRYNAGLRPNESEGRYWLNYKSVANFTYDFTGTGMCTQM